MAEIVLDQRDQALPRRLRGRQGHEPGDQRRRVHDPRRPVRLRQVDGAEDDRRTRGHHRRRAAGSASRSSTSMAPKDRDIAMVFQNYALYPHMTVRENMAFPLKLAKVDEGGDRREGRGGRRDPRPHRAPGPQAGEPLRRPAPACRDGPGDRPRSEGVPDGRAAVQPRREAARADAHRGLADPVTARARRPSMSPTTRPRR